MALSVVVKKVEDGSTLVVKAMSDKTEKITDVLKDLSVKMDDIKSDSVLIKEYTPLIEELFEKVGNVEEYLKERLATDFEKIKNIWNDYKSGKISRRELIKKALKILGKRFIKLIPIIM
ncbi:hypothetical protein LCGC14_1566390 [marine sediment metagenome]|uniref:Uncharacterized protein n=1 Tax=marine sediment metagenome TaxID=412755 RepID=A0A0F9LLH9_9ZZZZ